jgi:hypothetical protein
MHGILWTRRAEWAPVQLKDLGPAGYFIDKVKTLVCLHCRQRHHCGINAVHAEVLQQEREHFAKLDVSTCSLQVVIKKD